jgi:ATP-dependent exoDNAse (exonuclease V) beta subunit
MQSQNMQSQNMQSQNMLSQNMHPRDALIEFEAGPHKYTCKGEANYMSVTTWNHTHFQPFDADAIIAKMKLSNPLCKYYGQTPEQIKAGWDKGRDEAAAAGTEMHAAIEQYWLGFCPLTPDVGQNPPHDQPPSGGACGVSPHFGAFVNEHPHLKPYRTEWMIFDEDVRLAGSIDFVTENPDGSLTIYDWKRCKEIKKNNGFGVFARTECISHFPDTNYWHYALQLNTYKAILERKYEKKVKQMFLVGLHPDLPKYQVYTVPNLNEMTELFALREQAVL